jgi:hypothetical protein
LGVTAPAPKAGRAAAVSRFAGGAALGRAVDAAPGARVGRPRAVIGFAPGAAREPVVDRSFLAR